MDSWTHKLLETAALRTLHAHSFSRSSALATHLLTDFFSRYLALLASTSAKYAHHAGRRSLTVYDALGALDELGVGMDELTNFAAIEAKELSRYAVYSTRRIEDLNELRAQLVDGLRLDSDDRIHLNYALYDPLEDEGSDEETVAEPDQMQVDDAPPSPIVPQKRLSPRLPPSPPLPLSPVSNPASSPSRKRPRTAGWQPPEHIPDFLPPFPTAAPPSPVSPPPPDPEDQQMPPPMMPPLPPPLSIKLERPQLPPPPPPLQTMQHLQQQTMTSSAASDYLVQVPYSQSSLSSVPEWHLPSSIPPVRHPPSRNPPRTLPTPQTEHSLLAAYHYILTHPPPLHPLFPGRMSTPGSAANVPIGPNTLHPSRHKVAMTLLYQTQALPRWEPADSVFATVGPCPPRVAAIGPTYPIPISNGDDKDKNPTNKDFKFPPILARPVGAPERIASLVSQQSSRIPDLARHVLPPMIFSRTSRLSHPPILHRGQKPLTYGQGVPAPWNGNPSDATPQPPTPAAAKPGTKDALPNGKEKNKDADAQAKAAVLPDAKLYATWDYEPKDYRAPLVVPSRSRARIAVATGSTYTSLASPSASSPLAGSSVAGAGAAATGAVGGLRSRSSSRLVS